MVYLRGLGLVENEEQAENKMMKSIVVEEQEQEQEQELEQDEGSETRFVDLDRDTLVNVLKRVDLVTLGRAACVNKLWCKAADDDRLFEPIFLRYVAGTGMLRFIDRFRTVNGNRMLSRSIDIFNRRRLISVVAKPPPDFYSIDFSKKIGPWR